MVINAVIPIFALIFLGFFVARRNILPPEATSHLNLYIVWLALPALMFQVVTTTPWDELYQPEFFLGAFLPMLILYFAYLLWQKKSVHRSDRSINCVTISYSNTGYMGLPLCGLVFGPESTTPVVLTMIMTICFLFAITLAISEFSLQEEPSVAKALKKTIVTLLRNPLVIAPILGLLISILGIGLPKPVQQFTSMLSASASPCALVCIGLFIGHTKNKKFHPELFTQLWLKLLALPALTSIFVFFIFTDMPLLYKQAAILLAALPTGTGPFMLAVLFKRESDLTSQTIFISTVISLATVSALVMMFGL